MNLKIHSYRKIPEVIMNNKLFVVFVFMLFINMTYFNQNTSTTKVSKTIVCNLPFDIKQNNVNSSDTLKNPKDIIFKSSIGEVNFFHEYHVKNVEIKCIICHHQINANLLKTPHPNYFKSSWINCEICHTSGSSKKEQYFSCKKCHHTQPTKITDETLSSKVVIHKKCWECHEVKSGIEASKRCFTCHAKKNI
jgi:hypothetical protein